MKETCYDSEGNELKIGDKVRATIDLFDYSGSDTPSIEENELLEIDGIRDNNLTFTTIRDYLSFSGDFFVKVDDTKSKQKLIDEDIKHEQKKIKKLYEEIEVRRHNIERLLTEYHTIDEVGIGFVVDERGIPHYKSY
jgi:hypothetical protein